MSKLQGRGDNRSAAVIARISEEELAHVAVGVVWFRHLCRSLGADPGEAFAAHIGVHAPDALRGPFNHTARVAAGLDPAWYSVAPEHRMGHEFDAEGNVKGRADDALGEGGGSEAVGAPALVERLKQMLALEGVQELPPEQEQECVLPPEQAAVAVASVGGKEKESAR